MLLLEHIDSTTAIYTLHVLTAPKGLKMAFKGGLSKQDVF